MWLAVKRHIKHCTNRVVQVVKSLRVVGDKVGIIRRWWFEFGRKLAEETDPRSDHDSGRSRLADLVAEFLGTLTGHIR